MINESKLLSAFPEIQQQIEIAPMTTFKIGGKARYFLVVTNEEEMQKAVTIAR